MYKHSRKRAVARAREGARLEVSQQSFGEDEEMHGGVFEHEVVVHLTSLRNVDLHKRGLYYIRLTLALVHEEEGAEALPPSRYFSCPSRLESHVKGRRMPAPELRSTCGVDDELEAFCTRTFLVRYANEDWDLNDGCLFQFSSSETTVALQLDVELLHCPLLPPPADRAHVCAKGKMRLFVI